MPRESVDELLVVRYLLGNLTEEEQVQVEDRAFAERDYMGVLDAVEADLIDAYVGGGLARADRRAFERRFLTSPQRRSKVEFAQALARVTPEAATLATPVPKPATPWWTLLWNPVRAWNPALRWATALAAVICVAGGSWLAIDNASMRSRVSVLEIQRRDLERSTEGLKQQLNQAQARADGLAARVESRPSPEPSRGSLVASLVLMPGLSRAESRTGQLVVDGGTQLAHLEIPLDARDGYPRFRVELRTQSGKEILALGDLPRRRSGEGYTVSLDVPAAVLETGGYELALKGLRDGESPQDIGYYYFRVQKR